jgi:hypothetical protein
MNSIVHSIIVVLGLPRAVAALIIRMNAILEAMTVAKLTFTTPPVAIATVSAHVAALSSAESATKTRAAGTKQARDAARKLVVEDANQLHAYVQQLANASPTEAATIAAAAAMTLRKAGAHPKSDLAVKQGVSGTVHVVAKSVKGARSHEWQYSVDGGKSWVSATPTTQASTTLSGLVPGTVLQVRHRTIVKGGPGDWCPTVTMSVS